MAKNTQNQWNHIQPAGSWEGKHLKIYPDPIKSIPSWPGGTVPGGTGGCCRRPYVAIAPASATCKATAQHTPPTQAPCWGGSPRPRAGGCRPPSHPAYQLFSFYRCSFPESKMINRRRMLQMNDAFYTKDSLQMLPLITGNVAKGKCI